MYSPRFRGAVLSIGSVATETKEKTNGSGVTINKAEPVRLDSADTLQKINPSVEAQALATLGLAKKSALNLSTTQIVTSGRLEDVTTTASIGDVLYVSKTGGITNVKPSIGVGSFVEGDFVIQVGVVVRNEANPLFKDILVSVKVIGQL